MAYFAEQTAFSDVSFSASLLIEQGDTVVGEYVWRGTHTGAFTAGDGSVIPPTGKTSEFGGVAIIEVKDAKIANMREYFDVMTMMSQLGLIPGP